MFVRRAAFIQKIITSLHDIEMKDITIFLIISYIVLGVLNMRCF